MATNKVWLITGAGRGLGVDIVKAALAGCHKVVATGRNTDKVTKALGKSADLLVVDGNPLEDVGVLADPVTHLQLVMKAGQVYADRL